jgi:8-oxo-dGTP pyrophosphatase MutT (NUDIX family)
MEPIMKEKSKRRVVGFVPYRRAGQTYEFFFQKRTNDAPTSPGMFGIFGGGVEDGESAEQALAREIFEELAYKPENVRYFSRFESPTSMSDIFSDIFIEEVSDDFESKVIVQEGEYGKFIPIEDVIDRRLFSHLAIVAVPRLAEYLLKQ